MSAATGTVTVATSATLGGSGRLGGAAIVQSGATLSPGTGIGTLSFGKSLTLAAGSTNLFEISKSPATNDNLIVIGALTNGGFLIVTNISTNALAAGDSFKLFSAASYGGGFAGVTLPALAPGLGWSTNTLNTAGQLTVISIVPIINPPAPAGTNLVLRGGGGMPNGQYYVLASTNLALPIASWPRIATNFYDAAGNFSFTNPIAPGTARKFYLLQLP